MLWIWMLLSRSWVSDRFLSSFWSDGIEKRRDQNGGGLYVCGRCTAFLVKRGYLYFWLYYKARRTNCKMQFRVFYHLSAWRRAAVSATASDGQKMGIRPEIMFHRHSYRITRKTGSDGTTAFDLLLHPRSAIKPCDNTATALFPRYLCYGNTIVTGFHIESQDLRSDGWHYM